ncbi:zinc-ribbon domain-containing protein [Thalassobaculum sp.]|uniref:zinc-ribbon domain-containing protein n=1 Tax=Thalassobaculum sp. TaxID=2022740 RepID=UPI0032EC89A3
MRVTCPECEAKFKVPDKALGTTGRKLRCGSCSHQWMQAPPPPKPAKAPAEEGAGKPKAKAKGKAKAKPKPKPKPMPEPEPEDELPEEEASEGDEEFDRDDLRPPTDDDEGGMDPPPLGGVSRFRGARSTPPPKRRLPVALLVLTAAAFAIPGILVAARTSLVEAWPASALLYDTIGMHVDVPGEGLVLQNVYVQRRQEGSVLLLVVSGEISNPTEQMRSLPALRGTVLDARGDTLQSWLFTATTPQLLPGDVGRFQSEFAGGSSDASRVNVTFTHERPEVGVGY